MERRRHGGVTGIGRAGGWLDRGILLKSEKNLKSEKK